ncbi:FAD-dependent oxidoreductase [Clostridium grantii]|uniref:Thioredoxin reductase n=1 Tax=Clostridium grantii DSM 8605 TaxID=1121316 RepID=A0A1M5VVU5_9CLOT|nr:FAD-dependent oxidoreductase [Clostridium grantii]SHH79114.1 Thioredoxin reductase [Clostridium grantii DSM 8605]
MYFIIRGRALDKYSGPKKMVEYIIDKCAEFHYEIAAVTNAYDLIDYIDILKKAKVKELQVTLDGSKEVHNSRRGAANGKGTFDRIILGMEKAIENKIPINFRTVLDNENIGDLINLVEFLDSKGWLDLGFEYFKTQIGRNYELFECYAKPQHLMSQAELWAKYAQLSREYPILKKFHKPDFKGIRHLVETGNMYMASFDTCPATKTEWVFDFNEDVKYVKTEDTEFYAKAAIIASGASPRALNAEDADLFKGKGIHYCATCDGSMYQDRKIVVIGGGNSAVEEAVFLTRFATHVTIIHQFDHFQSSLKAQEEALSNEKIDVIWDSEVRKVNGQGHALTSVVVENIKTKEITEVPTEGAFVYIGTEPKSTMYKGQVNINDWGYIVAGEDTKTDVGGVFVAGDIRTKAIRQVVTAASDGAVSAIMAERYISDLK